MKVLIIEDNKADYVLIKEMIESAGNESFDIRWVQRLREGMAIAEKEDFDIALLDLGLPDSKGLETFEQFSRNAGTMPIIILSGLDDMDTALLAVRKGAQDYLSKNNINEQILKRAMKYAIERKQTEDALKESEEKFKIIFDESLDVIAIIDSYSGLIYNINPAAYHIMGYKKKMLIGKHYSTFLPNDKYLTREDFLGKVVVNGAVFESQIFVKADGSPIQMDLSATVIPWGKSKAILVSLRDATERLKVENAINRLNKELEKRVVERTNQLEETMKELKNEITFRTLAEEKLKEAKNEITKAWMRERELSDQKTKFIKMVTSEYRTPLSVISSSAEFLEIYDKNEHPDKYQRHLNNILNAVDSMTKLLENVLTIEALQSGTYQLNYEDTDYDVFLKNIIESCIYSDKNQHKVSIRSAVKIGKIKIDRELTRSIISNLVGNAMKFSGSDSEIIISSGLHNNNLTIIIQDQGKGMTEEEQNSVFEPFNQMMKRDGIGSLGIGLHIVQSCLKVLGGKIEIDSMPFIGTNVEVKFPVYVEELIFQ